MSSSDRVTVFSTALLKKMYRLQDEINHLFVNRQANQRAIASKEVAISKLFQKLRGVREQEKRVRSQ